MHSVTPDGGPPRPEPGEDAGQPTRSGITKRRTAPRATPSKSAATRSANRSATTARRSAGRTAPDAAPAGAADPSSPLDRSRRWGGRRRLGDLYDRRAQRTHERWPLTARVLSALLRHPEVLLAAVGQRAPVERDGRVLNRVLQAMLAVANRLGADATSPADLPTPSVMRQQLRRSAQAVMPVRTDVHVVGRLVPGADGGPARRLRIYRRFGSGLTDGPGSRRALPAIVFFHGGGWVTGDLDSHDALCRLLAVASGCVVVAVDYRLAPEHPFPAAVDDALAAYAWVHAHTEELGIDPGRIGVMGDSAGGNLAAVVAQATRAGRAPTNTPPPVAQGLVYPVVDGRLVSESMDALAQGFLLTRADMVYYRDHYLPDRSDWEHPRASPLLADDLGGLAPALVVTAGFDPLRDDGTAYADALAEAGVPVEHRRYEDQIHGFMILAIAPDSLAAAIEVCESMGRLMRRAAPTAAAG